MRHGRSDYRYIVDLRETPPEEFRELLRELGGGDGNPGIGRDEPVFLIRGRDVTAPTAIREWAAVAREHGADAAAADAEAWAAEVEAWQQSHHDRVKVPDRPPRRCRSCGHVVGPWAGWDTCVRCAETGTPAEAE